MKKRARNFIGQQRKKVVISLFTLCIGFYGICSTRADSYPPLPEALEAMEPDWKVMVQQVTVPQWEEGSAFYYAFIPKRRHPQVGFIFYPGARVDPRSYAPPAHAIAAEGFLVIIVKMPGDFAFNGYTRAETIEASYPMIETWVIGGHSLGGTFACAYAREFPDVVTGVILWASFPSSIYSLADTDLRVLSIYGTNDGFPDELAASAKDLPEDTKFVVIEGGNHTQFGWYDTGGGPQEGDNPADITREEQQEIIIEATANFLKTFCQQRCPVEYLLGDNNPHLVSIRKFRDEFLSKYTAGKQLIKAFYHYREAEITMLNRYPFIRKDARWFLESVACALELMGFQGND